jgi:hypothetical protein
MAYVIEAFLGAEDSLRRLDREIRTVPLSAGIAMAPFTSELRSAMGSMAATGDPEPSWPFRKLSKEAARIAQEASLGGSLAYVEAEYFGGAGDQGSIVWKDGGVLSGPTGEAHAINHALRQLGVNATSERDEFDVVGLGTQRATEDWVPSSSRP